MRSEYINPAILDEIIREKERGYLGTIVNLFLYPRFIEVCERAIEEATDSDERRESLTKMITSHQMTLRGEEESLETWELLLPYLYSLRTLCTQPTADSSEPTTTPPNASSTASEVAVPSEKS